jgi:hypothetical protein
MEDLRNGLQEKGRRGEWKTKGMEDARNGMRGERTRRMKDEGNDIRLWKRKEKIIKRKKLKIWNKGD